MTSSNQLESGILTAPLAQIDRRALSQAWYSALHVDRAPRAGSNAAGPRLPAKNVPSLAKPPAEVVMRRPVAASVAAASARAGRTAHRRAAFQAERRAPRSTLARAIERVARRHATASRSLVAVEADGTRALIVLHGETGRLRIVAFCAASARRTVAKALEQARYVLAARGVSVATSIGAETCL